MKWMALVLVAIPVIIVSIVCFIQIRRSANEKNEEDIYEVAENITSQVGAASACSDEDLLRLRTLALNERREAKKYRERSMGLRQNNMRMESKLQELKGDLDDYKRLLKKERDGMGEKCLGKGGGQRHSGDQLGGEIVNSEGPRREKSLDLFKMRRLGTQEDDMQSKVNHIKILKKALEMQNKKVQQMTQLLKQMKASCNGHPGQSKSHSHHDTDMDIERLALGLLANLEGQKTSQATPHDSLLSKSLDHDGNTYPPGEELGHREVGVGLLGEDGYREHKERHRERSRHLGSGHGLRKDLGDHAAERWSDSRGRLGSGQESHGENREKDEHSYWGSSGEHRSRVGGSHGYGTDGQFREGRPSDKSYVPARRQGNRDESRALDSSRKHYGIQSEGRNGAPGYSDSDAPYGRHRKVEDYQESKMRKWKDIKAWFGPSKSPKEAQEKGSGGSIPSSIKKGNVKTNERIGGNGYGKGNRPKSESAHTTTGSETAEKANKTPESEKPKTESKKTWIGKEPDTKTKGGATATQNKSTKKTTAAAKDVKKVKNTTVKPSM